MRLWPRGNANRPGLATKVAGPGTPEASGGHRAVDPEARQRSIRRRMLLVAVGLALGLVLAAGRALMLQTVHHEQLEYEAAQNYVRTVAVDDWRGDLVDRNGALLALSVHRWAVTADPQRVAEPMETAGVLGRVLQLPTEPLETKLGARAEETRRRVRGESATARAARRLVQPAADAVADTFGFARASFDMRLQLVAYFTQMEQVQVSGIHKIVDVLTTAADAASAAIASDAEALRFFPSRGRRFSYIARDIDDDAARRVVEAKDEFADLCRKERTEGRPCVNPLGAVRIVPEPRRYYPKREVGAQLVGMVGSDDKGLSGIERSLDGLIGGGHSRIKAVRDHRGRAMLLDGIPDETPLAAPSVELAIDEKIQAFAEAKLGEACMVSGARAGYAVVMRIKTGEILAAANYPTFNPNSYTQWYRDRQPLLDERRAFKQAEDDLKWSATSPLVQRAYPDSWETVLEESRQAHVHQYDAFVEYAHAYPDATRANAFLDVYEPGSITKVFTLAAGLEEGVVDLERIYDLEGGELQLHDPEDTRIRDSSRHEDGNAAFVIKKSSNIGAAKMGFDVGAERLERYLHAFGFGAATGSGFPGEASGLLLPSSDWSIVHLANISFGQGFAATGVQLASALSALGNGGVLMKPLLVKRIIDHEGRTVRTFEPEVVRQVISPRSARTVIDLMRGVIEPDGTGRSAYIAEYPVAGKTGTGQKSHLRKRGYAEDMWVATFFGVAPADDPELAVVILVDEPKGKRHSGGTFAAPAFRRIMRWSLMYLGVPSPYESGKQVAWVDPTELAKRRAQQAQADADDELAKLAPPVDAGHQGEVPVPDFHGLTMDQVRALAFKSGLRVTYRGSGLAQRQDTEAHTRVPAWSTVAIDFRPRAPKAGRYVADAPQGQGADRAATP